MSTEGVSLFTEAPAEPEPQPCPVVTLYPDGIFLRDEGDATWIERRHGTRSTCAVKFTVEEQIQLRDKLIAKWGLP